MNITKTILEDHQAELAVEFDGEVFENYKRRAAKRIARSKKIPGFRPGKAPYAVVVRQVGEGVIIEEALEILVDDKYPEIIREAEVNPYGPGSIKEIPSMDPLKIIFTVPLQPEVEIGDYKSIRAPYEKPELDEALVEDTLQQVRERYAVVEPVERPVEVNDIVTTRINAYHINTEDGEKSLLLEDAPYPLIVTDDKSKEEKQEDSDEDSSTPEEWPFTGFTAQLIGLGEGDKKTIVYSYPEDYPDENFRGKDVEFNVEIVSVKERVLPEVDDELAASVGEYGSADEMIAHMRESLGENLLRNYEEEYSDMIMEQIMESSEYKYPPQMVEEEIDAVIKSLESRLQQQGFTLDLYLKSREITMEELRDEARLVAEKRIKSLLTVEKIAELEKIEVGKEEFEEEVEKLVGELGQIMPPEELQKLLQSDSTSSLASRVMLDLYKRKTLDKLISIARGIEDAANEEETPETEDVEITTTASEATKQDEETTTDEMKETDDEPTDSSKENETTQEE